MVFCLFLLQNKTLSIKGKIVFLFEILFYFVFEKTLVSISSSFLSNSFSLKSWRKTKRKLCDKIIQSLNSFEICLVRIAHTSFRLWRDIARKILWWRNNSFSSCSFWVTALGRFNSIAATFNGCWRLRFYSNLIQIFRELKGLLRGLVGTVLECIFGLKTLLEKSVHSSSKTVQFRWERCTISGQRSAEIRSCLGAIFVTEKTSKTVRTWADQIRL